VYKTITNSDEYLPNISVYAPQMSRNHGLLWDVPHQVEKRRDGVTGELSNLNMNGSLFLIITLKRHLKQSLLMTLAFNWCALLTCSFLSSGESAGIGKSVGE